MASKVLVEYRKRVDELDAGLVEATGSRNGGRRRTERDVCAFCTAKLSVVSSIAESRAGRDHVTRVEVEPSAVRARFPMP
jgi:hypothetical protein